MSTRMLFAVLLAGPGCLGLVGCFKDGQDGTSSAGASTTSMASMSSTNDAPGTSVASTSMGPVTAGATEPTSGATGGGTGGSTDMTDTGDGTTGSFCPGLIQVLPPSRPSVMLVIDRSGSMANLTWDHDGVADTPVVTHWSSVYAAVSATLASFDTTVNIGLSSSPSTQAKSDYTEAACVVKKNAEVAPGPNNGAAILAELPAKTSQDLQGADPIAAALANARTALEQTDATLPRLIVLVSDGLAQCHAGATGEGLFEVYDPDAALVAGQALAAGIPVHVIGVDLKDVITGVSKDGIPDSVGYLAKYEELATAGGTAPFVNATVETTLTVALAGPLETAVAKVDPCLVALEEAASDPAQTHVVLAGEELAPVEDCATTSGWRFVGPLPHTAIEVCGAACAEFQAEGAIEVAYCDSPE